MNGTAGAGGRLCALLVIFLLSGCATTQQSEEGDPLEQTNRGFYKFNDGLDRHIFKPVAEQYVKVTPEPLRTSVTNFFDNVSYINVIVNDLLQGKLDQFFMDVGRFVFNSTIGLGGLFDPATDVGLKTNDEDLGQTLGYWGAEEGAYLVLPLFGPDSLRDVPDRVSSAFLNPLFYMSAPVTWPLTVLNAINTRANYLEATRFVEQAALDPYTFTREAYRQRREYLIYDGNPPSTGFDEFIEGEEGPPEEPGGVLKVF
jgi:phospholipid-binding lipoprotein MlaA